MRKSIEAFLETMNEYGQPAVELLATDKPFEDKNFFHDMIPTLKEAEVRYNSGCGTPDLVNPDCALDPTRYWVLGSTREINERVDAVRAMMGALPASQNVVGLDAEWDTHKTPDGMVRGRGRVAVIQLSYRKEVDGVVHCLVIQALDRKTLPARLLEWFQDTTITWTGRNVSGDIAHIGRDFNCQRVADGMKGRVCELGNMARRRDAVPIGSAGLETLVEAVLKEKLSKSPVVRLSKWSSPVLNNDQKTYAALDAIKSLEVYFKLADMPDLSSRLTSSEVHDGSLVDVVPSRGCVSVMATRGALARIIPQADWSPPPGCSPPLLRPSTVRCLVQITTVLAPFLVVPGITKNGAAVTLGDFGNAPFAVMLPLKMLKHHVPGDYVRICPGPVAAQQAGRPAAGLPGHAHVGADSDGAVAPPPCAAHSSALLLGAAACDRDEIVDTDMDDAFSAGPPNDGDADRADMTVDDVEMLRATQQAASLAQWSGEISKLLGNTPDHIQDVFSSVLGDGFHFMDRPKVPVHHECKKAYFHALQEAWFAWDPDKLKEVTDALLQDGVSQADIEAKMYYNVDYFRVRVPRVVLPPSKLYPRVRAVFELYGSKVDSETQKPLFNKTAWAKAKRVLEEIVLGLASDPPGVQFYTVQLDQKGQPKLDAYGSVFVNCNRGTNDTECVHKQIVTTFGTWNTGVELGDLLMAERRHRYNHKVSERRRLGFPILGHFDTWLIDSLQVLVEHNHGIQLYQEWSNASDYKETGERFGTVRMHTDELDDAMKRINLARKPIMSDELQYLCTSSGTSLPFLPVYGDHEYRAFADLLLRMPDVTDYDAMAIKWCEMVDGVHIWPKLPVYLRTYHRRFRQNQRVRDAVRKAKTGEEKLKALNQDTLDRGSMLAPSLPGMMPQAAASARHANNMVCVGGQAVGGAPDTTVPKKRHGDRGVDHGTRRKRTCKTCAGLGLPAEQAQNCPGSTGRGSCTSGVSSRDGSDGGGGGSGSGGGVGGDGGAGVVTCGQ